MKKMLPLMLLVALTLTACNPKSSEPPQKKGSSGKTLELMIVADKDVYRGETKALIDSLFGRPQVGLPVPEKMFDIVNIPVSSYKNTEMFQNHRNIIFCDVNPGNPDKVYMHIDEYAAPQVVFDFAVKDQAALRDMLRKYEHHILDQVYNAEHRRVIKAFKGMENFKINEAIRKHLSNANLKMDDLGDEMGLSRVQLYRKVKAATGQTPVELLRQMRLQRAYALLTSTNKTVQEIAYEVGFGTPGYFSKCFKQQYGKYPMDLRTE